MRTIEVGKRIERVGLRASTFNENTSSFSNKRSFGEVEGVEYGYLFDSITKENVVYALVMTFDYLEGSRRSVDVIKSKDNGENWSFVRNLSSEFGDIPINESAIIECESGFLIATRGYDDFQRIHKVDENFKLQYEENLAVNYDFIGRMLGRPRFFKKEDKYYLIGRNHVGVDNENAEMALFEIDQKSLEIRKYIILDNADRGKHRDGYYPFPYFKRIDGIEYLGVIDYRAHKNEATDIISFTFEWEDLISD